MICWATRTSLHTEQCFPSVNPASVHVAATAASTTSVCPNAAVPSLVTSCPQLQTAFNTWASVHVGADTSEYSP